MRSSYRSPQIDPLIGRRRWVSYFFFYPLKALLAAKAAFSPRQSIQAPWVDFVATGYTHAENALLNSSQRCLDHAHHPPSFAGLSKKSFLGQRRLTKIPDVPGIIGIDVAGFISQTSEMRHRVCSLDFENAPETQNF